MQSPINKITTIIMFRLTLLLALSCLAYGKSLSIPQGASKSDVRIVGGVATTIEKHPHQVAVELNENQHCGGSLIKPDFVLTAAHCTEEHQAGDFQVRAGSTKNSEGGQVALVVSICDHPKYSPITVDYDVSVLRLDRSLELGAGVQTITLQPIDVAVPDGTLGTVTGWGLLSSESSVPNVLQEVRVPKISDSSCEKKIPSRITSRMTCYGGERNKDSCTGDSGGPLVVKGKQVGIVSWGIDCAFRDFPGMYTRIENKEIHDHINSCLKV